MTQEVDIRVPTRARRTASKVLLLALFLGAPCRTARCDEPTPVDDIATRVMDARRLGDEATLRRLAASSIPDPWLVSRELVRRNAYEAAEAFASAAPRPETAGLGAWLQAARQGGAASSSLDAIRADARAGATSQKAEKYVASAAAYERAARAARDVGWLAMASTCFEQAARSLFRAARYSEAREAADAELASEKTLDSAEGEGRALFLLGLVDSATGDHAHAAERLARALELAQQTGDSEGRANALNSLGYLAAIQGRYDEAAQRWEEALGTLDAAPSEVHAARFAVDPALHQRLMAQVLMNLGGLRFKAGEIEAAHALLDRATRAAESSGEPREIASVAEFAGSMHLAVGERFEALAHYERALQEIETANAPAEKATISRRLGGLRRELGDLPGAQRLLEDAWRTLAAEGKRRDAAWALLELARTRKALGESPSALDACRQVVSEALALPDPPLEAQAWLEVGDLQRAGGAFSEAEDAYEKSLAVQTSLGAKGKTVGALVRLAGLAEALGRSDDARARFEEARRAADVPGEDARVRGDVEMAWGFHEVLHGEGEQALAAFGRAEQRYAEAKDPQDRARALSAAGASLRAAGRTPEAADALERALGLLEGEADPLGRARARMNLALVRHAQGRDDEALQMAATALDEANASGYLDAEIECRWGLAALLQASGDDAGALAAAAKTLPLLDQLGRHLAEGEDAEVRRGYAPVFDIGAVSAIALGDTGALYRFLEAGRARTLLKALGGRAALAEVVESPDVRREEAAARAAEALALARFTAARAKGVLAEVRQARTALDDARKALTDLLVKAQRDERVGVDLVYPSTVPLARVQHGLEPHGVLVVYALLYAEAVALVVTPQEVRIVALGDTESAREAAERLLADIRGGTEPAVRAAAEDLRRRVVDPLKLPANASPVLVSPDGVLCRVPFATLLPAGMPVVYVPSASAYDRLRGDAGTAGEGVLAFGDPAYGGALPRLPATRAEVEAVGTTVYVGTEATETRLREVARAKHRWRAIHLACHGLIDADRPMLTSLALAPDGSNDGRLTVYDVFDLRLPCDLAVLSGCETAGGEIVEGEGVVGLVRAFMFAGAPRVLCSLWKVDDEATRALMTKFYALYRPADGSAGLDAARALLGAQAYLRAQPKWASQRYWAAWVLWGVP